MSYWLVIGDVLGGGARLHRRAGGVGATLSRGLFLTKAHRWQIFVAILLVGTVNGASESTIWHVAVADWIAYTATLSILIVFAPSPRLWPLSSMSLAKDRVPVAGPP
jgi:hypothetical protein